MSNEGRRVFEFDPSQGFTQIKDNLVVADDSKQPVSVEPPVDVVDIPKPQPQPEPDDKVDTPIDAGVEQPEDIDQGEEEDVIDTPAPDNQVIEGVGDQLGNEDDSGVDVPEDGTEGEPEGDIGGDVPQTDDFFVAAATRLRSSGKLPEDFQLDENLTEDEADLKIYEAYVDKLRPEANQELLSEFQREMQKKGWTETTLEYASMLENGVTESEIAQIQDYRTLAAVDAASMSSEDKDEYIRQMYRDRGWKDKEIKRALDTADMDGETDALVAEASQYFDQRGKESTEQQKHIAQQNALQRQKVEQYKQAVISHVFNNREIGGETLNEDQLDVLEEALYTRNIPVQLQDGQVYQVSPYEQFQSALQNDFGLQIWAFKKWLFREQEAQQYMAQAQRAAEESQVVKWGKRSKKVKTQETKTDTPLANPTPKNTSTAQGRDTYIMEGGVIKKVSEQ